MWDSKIPLRGQDLRSRTKQSFVLDHYFGPSVEFRYPPLVIMNISIGVSSFKEK